LGVLRRTADNSPRGVIARWKPGYRKAKALSGFCIFVNEKGTGSKSNRNPGRWKSQMTGCREGFRKDASFKKGREHPKMESTSGAADCMAFRVVMQEAAL
jgi:hypothetical protein